MRKSEQDLKEYATKQAETIVIRTYENSNSQDERRLATKREKKIIQSIVYGGLLSIHIGSDVQSVADACEYIAKLQLPDINGYLTVYLPIKQFPWD